MGHSPKFPAENRATVRKRIRRQANTDYVLNKVSIVLTDDHGLTRSLRCVHRFVLLLRRMMAVRSIFESIDNSAHMSVWA